jgi:hypothetical protein
LKPSEGVIYDHTEEERCNMDERYQGYLIRSGAQLNTDTNQWTPTLSVLSDQGPSRLLWKEIVFSNTFSTKAEAQVCAHRFGISWIDAGKPALPKGTSKEVTSKENTAHNG